MVRSEVMQDQMYKIFKMKALDRWENEGGRFCTDQTSISRGRSTEERAGIDNAARHFERSTANGPNSESKGGSI